MREPDRYEKLTCWPDRRPSTVNFIHDYTNSTVYITNGRGARMLAIPFDRFLSEAESLKGDT